MKLDNILNPLTSFNKAVYTRSDLSHKFGEMSKIRMCEKSTANRNCMN